MSKIIIHNEEKINDMECLVRVKAILNKLKEEKRQLQYGQTIFYEFGDKIKVQVYQQKTCKTFYIY